jgi:predicted Zn finger-like uncharacterized protein
MILTCPQCATRYQTDAAAFQPAGRRVRCAKCGHVWFQEAPRPEPAEAELPRAAPPEPPRPEPVRAAYAEPAPARTYEDEEAPPAPAFRLPLDRIALAAGWLGLVAAVLVIGWAAVSYREEIATLWPQSSSLYSALGLKVNARGIAFSGVSRHYETEDDQVVLAVSGNIVNVSKRELPVPQVEVTLTGKDTRALYHWSFTPGAATLRPGQSVHFLTRLSNPPGAARHLELRFADAGG